MSKIKNYCILAAFLSFVFLGVNAQANSQCTLQGTPTCADSTHCKYISGVTVCLSGVTLPPGALAVSATCWDYSSSYNCDLLNINTCKQWSDLGYYALPSTSCARTDTVSGQCELYNYTYEKNNPGSVAITTGTGNTCQPLIDQGCHETSSSCISTDSSGNCTSTAYEYSCTTPGTGAPTITTSCGSQVFCQGTLCNQTSGTPNQNMNAVLSASEAASLAGKYMNPNTLKVFDGVKEDCTIQMWAPGSLGNCCNIKAGAQSNHSVTAGLMGTAIQAGSKMAGIPISSPSKSGLLSGAISVGGYVVNNASNYVFDQLYQTSEGYWAVQGFRSAEAAVGYGPGDLDTLIAQSNYLQSTLEGLTTTLGNAAASLDDYINQANQAESTLSNAQSQLDSAQLLLNNNITPDNIALVQQCTANVQAASAATAQAYINVSNASGIYKDATSAYNSGSAAVDAVAGSLKGTLAPPSFNFASLASYSAYGFTASLANPAGWAMVQGVATQTATTGIMAAYNSATIATNVGGVWLSFNPYALAASVVLNAVMEALQCDPSTQNLAMAREKNLCHYVGSFCSNKVPLIGTCLETTQAYCCFNSLLSKIIQEGGRPQLGMGWGAPQSPDCSGFTTSQLSSIDFSKIDMSSFVAQITSTLPDTAKAIQGVTARVNQLYGSGTACVKGSQGCP